MASSNERVITIKRSVDMNIVGENIADIVDFAIEKYEFRNDTTLAGDVREKATASMRDALWAEVERMKALRKEWLQKMFDTADAALLESVDGS